MIQGILILIMVYVIGYFYYERKVLVFYHNTKSNLYYCKRETLYNIVENRNKDIKINYVACKNNFKNLIKK